MKTKFGMSVGDMDPGDAPKSGNPQADKLMSPNAKEDMDTVSGDNPQKAWMGKGGKPKAPFGPQGRNF